MNQGNSCNFFPSFSSSDLKIIKSLDCIHQDEFGNEYLDLHCENGLLPIGYNHPYFLKAQEMGQNLNLNSYLLNEKITEKIVLLSNYIDYRFLMCTSRDEINKMALKLAISNTKKETIISLNHLDYPEFSILEVGQDLDLIKKAISENEVAAVIFEPISLENFKMPGEEFIRTLRQLCTQQKVILIADETNFGLGRSGRFFAHQLAEIKADIVTCSKGMGKSLSGILYSPLLEKNSEFVSDTSIEQSRAFLSVLEIMDNDRLIELAEGLGFYISRALNRLPRLLDIRGKGLMLAMEFDFPVQQIKDNLRQKHRILVESHTGNLLFIQPSLTLQKAYIDKFLAALEQEILAFS